jgi:hypothetical protein
MKGAPRQVIGMTVALLVMTATARVEAGWMDKMNAAAKKMEQASQNIERKSQAMQQNMRQRNAVQHAKTPTTNEITGEWGTQNTCDGPNSATCMNGMDDLMNCMHQAKGYFYRLIAVNLEGQLADNKELTAQQRKDMAVDLEAVKAAVATGKIVEPDPNNRQRWLRWLSQEEDMEIQKQNIKYTQEVRADCNARFAGMR